MQTRRTTPLRHDSQRPGYILPLLGVLLVVLIGMLGLVIDCGFLMSTQRQAHNAADAAARACALRVRYIEGNGGNISAISTSEILQPIADTYATATTHNTSWKGSTPSGTAVVVNHPPLAGPYTGNNRYVEVKVTYPVDTTFIRVLGVGNSNPVVARAVAGYEARIIPGAGLIVLDWDGNPGLTVGGSNARVEVRADIYVYSLHQGDDEFTPPSTVGGIDFGSGQPAATISGSGATITGTYPVGNPLAGTPVNMFVSGGVDDNANFSQVNLNAGTLGHPDQGLFHGVFDPFFNEGVPLPVPTTSNGVDVSNINTANTSTHKYNGDVSVSNNEEVFMHPGIYSSISINGGDVTFYPGIYVLQPPASGGGGDILSILNGTVHGVGGQDVPAAVMFYNTGSTYDPATGGSDPGDLGHNTDYRPTNSDISGENFMGIKIHDAEVNFSGLTTPGPFTDMLFYQRRINTQSITINDGPTNNGLSGTVYAKWADLKLAGNGTYNFSIVVGTMSTNGNAVVNVPYGLPGQTKVSFVYLVE